MEEGLDAGIRTLIASPFLVSALDKTFRPAAAEIEIAALSDRINFTFPPKAALFAVLIVQWIGGAAMLIQGLAPAGAWLLVAFLIPVTLIAHPFWVFPQDQRAMKRDHFFGNVAILGGLLLVAVRAT